MSERLEKRIAACAHAIERGDGLQEALGVSNAYVAKVQDKAHELYLADRDEEAEVLCRGLIALAPKRFYAHLLLSDILRRGGRMPESFRSIREAMNLAPENDLVVLKFAQALMSRGEFDRARATLSKVKVDGDLAGQAKLLASRCGVRS